MNKLLSVFLAIVMTIALFASPLLAVNGLATPPSITVSGTITKIQALTGTSECEGGVTVTAVDHDTSVQVGTDTSAQSGSYSITGFTSGSNYDITPTKTGCIFSPDHRTVQNLTPNPGPEDFTAIDQITIGGTVKATVTNTPVSGVTITPDPLPLGVIPPVTGVDGSYTLILPPGVYTLHAALAGFVVDNNDLQAELTTNPMPSPFDFTGSFRINLPLVSTRSPIIFEDDFSTDKGWQLLTSGTTAGISNGEYRLYTKVSQLNASLAPVAPSALPAAGYTVSVEADLVSGSDLTYGIIFDWVGASDYAMAVVSPSAQKYQVYHYYNNNFQKLVLGDNSATGIHAASNVIKLVRKSAGLDLYVNNMLQPVNSTPIALAIPAGGRVGLVMNSYNYLLTSLPAETHFDNFVVGYLP